MKIITLQKNLKESLYAVSHIAQKNTSLPILNNILISAREGVIKLITTNLEIGITSVVRGKIEEEGEFPVLFIRLLTNMLLYLRKIANLYAVCVFRLKRALSWITVNYVFWRIHKYLLHCDISYIPDFKLFPS